MPIVSLGDAAAASQLTAGAIASIGPVYFLVSHTRPRGEESYSSEWMPDSEVEDAEEVSCHASGNKMKVLGSGNEMKGLEEREGSNGRDV